ncbi:DUF5809 family protein [Natrononativus amylolyticus]|uniref:DUF5809 family protein n=1 Tax=Natrononativus amylolyticus TaxID=2963434 RepID=UPI0020CCE7D0|nr:DUF5809 family protein [Natrononativus amylolyticus]
MHTVGTFAFDAPAEAVDRYESLAPAAQTVVRETARAMALDREEYAARVSDDVVETAHDALFASLLAVRVGTRDEYERWLEGYNGDVTEIGNENVENVAWHAGPDGAAVAATFHEREDAAVATLRRQAFGRLYRELL